MCRMCLCNPLSIPPWLNTVRFLVFKRQQSRRRSRRRNDMGQTIGSRHEKRSWWETVCWWREMASVFQVMVRMSFSGLENAISRRTHRASKTTEVGWWRGGWGIRNTEKKVFIGVIRCRQSGKKSEGVFCDYVQKRGLQVWKHQTTVMETPSCPKHPFTPPLVIKAQRFKLGPWLPRINTIFSCLPCRVMWRWSVTHRNGPALVPCYASHWLGAAMGRRVLAQDDGRVRKQ